MRALIAVVDATRARLFTYQSAVDMQELASLHEESDLINVTRHRRPSELFSDSPGSDRVRGFVPRGFAYYDHRDAHMAQFDAVFARDIGEQIAQVSRAGGYVRLILIASATMIGEMRKVVRDRDLVIDEVPRDLVKLTPSQLHDRLAELRLLPARERLMSARR
jgi:protein required for attachment to host cells